MTDSRGNKAGEQGNRGKSLNNVKWNENPSVCGPVWLAQFKKRSIATSVGNSDWECCKFDFILKSVVQMNDGSFVTVRNNESDYIDPLDYQQYRHYLTNRCSICEMESLVACLYFGNGKLQSGAFRDCLWGIASFHDYSIGYEICLITILRMPQRIKLNPLNESYFFFPYFVVCVITRRSDAKSARQRTCQQLRDYIHIPIDGYGSQNKLWVRNNYRRIHFDVVIVNGPCKEDVLKHLSKYLTNQTIVIVLGRHTKWGTMDLAKIGHTFSIVEADTNLKSFGYLVLKKLPVCYLPLTTIRYDGTI